MPELLGSVSVLSAVGFVTVSVVSKSLAVAPSNWIELSVNDSVDAVALVIVGEMSVGLVKVLFVNVSVPAKVATVASIAK